MACPAVCVTALSQLAQLPVAHRRSTNRYRIRKIWSLVGGMLALSDISCTSHATFTCPVTISVDRLFLHRFINLANAVALWISQSRSSVCLCGFVCVSLCKLRV